MTLILAGTAAFALAACGDNRTDDVVQAPAEGGAAQPVTEQQADTATAETALALGMTRKALEDADLVSGAGVQLGEVESLLMDAQGKVTHLIVEVEGQNDVKVQVPIDKVTAYTAPNSTDQDLKTDLTPAELVALPKAVVR
ncbi:PRC-barrel domain-containing protein [Brevundimonas sp.]|uniref:PRC-barrel domain-containing protein n=1 Tax=Brevundimonas sp. TaxID=1871086 RepID=UPI0028990FA0|nr:PRC-barrel domain-containing protein [Brevundimonas sp.]